MYNQIIKELQKKSAEGQSTVNLKEFMDERELTTDQFEGYLNQLEKAGLIEFTYEITTTGLTPRTVYKGHFGDIKRVEFGEDYLHNFYCTLTYKGSKEKIE
jgi:hypothetical protein